MLGRGSDEFIFKLEHTYRSLCNIKFLYQILSESQKEKFIDALNKNPIRKVIEAESISISKIYNFYAFEDYFLYEMGYKKGILLVRKDDIRKVENNIRTSILNNFRDKNFLLN